VHKSADRTVAFQGQVVTYRVAFTNTGAVPFPAGQLPVVTDHLAQVLDDADLIPGSLSASVGSASYHAAGQEIVWHGQIQPAEQIDFTYRVRVHNPDTADLSLDNVVVAPHSNCAAGSMDDECRVHIPVPTPRTPGLRVHKQADRPYYLPGQRVHYTITLTDTGAAPLRHVVATDDLTGTFDDARYDNDARATSGTVSFHRPRLTWTGDIAPGATVTLTYSVTADNPDRGNLRIDDAVTVPHSNCSVGTAPGCSVHLNSPRWVVDKREDRDDVVPNDVIHYTITAHNTGTFDFTGAYQASLEDDLSQIVADSNSIYDADATASTGSISTHLPYVVWRGDLPAGHTVTIHLSIRAEGLHAGQRELTNIVRALFPHNGGTDLSHPLPAVAASTRALPAAGLRSMPLAAAPRAAAPRAAAEPGATVDPANGQITACKVDPVTDSCYVDADEPAFRFVVAKHADRTTVRPGETITYTVAFGNTGVDRFPAGELPVLTDDLSGTLSGGRLVAGSLHATTGDVHFDAAAQAIVWTGQLASGQHGSFTYRVRVDSPYHGPKTLKDVIVSPGSNCPAGSMSGSCVVRVTVTGPGAPATAGLSGLLAHTGADEHFGALLWASGALTAAGGLALAGRRLRARRKA
jgi:uncharacterized repeat protein (TIGR01451 family)